MKRIMTVVPLAMTLCAAAAGTAAADEWDSHNAPVVALISTGQIDDPFEDVLEHALNFGDGHSWG